MHACHAVGAQGCGCISNRELSDLARGKNSGLRRLTKQVMQSGFGHHVTSVLIGLCARIVVATTRWTTLGVAELEQNYLRAVRRVIVVMWHNRVVLMPFAWTFRDHQLTVLISDHRDRRLTGKILQAASVDCIRVPATAGVHSTPQHQNMLKTSTVREILRHVRKGRTISVVGDGPTGPRFHLKPSAIELVRLCKA